VLRTYFLLGSLLHKFADGDDAFWNSHFKLIPSIVEVGYTHVLNPFTQFLPQSRRKSKYRTQKFFSVAGVLSG
jgi:hypothetical protein